MKNILLLNTSRPSITPLYDLINELSNKSHNFTLISYDKNATEKFRQKNIKTIKIPKLININKTFNLLLFILLFPLWMLSSFFFILYLKTVKKIDIIFFCNWYEKISFTFFAHIFKIKCYWLEYPGLNYKKINKLLLVFYKFHSKYAKSITFINFTKEKLIELGVVEDNIKIIKPGITFKSYQHQDNIFNNLANQDSTIKKRKFFTIGTIAEINKKQNFEVLFQAITKSLTVVPNIQLIIIGDGEERKTLNWLTKKMEINNLTWFVGRQKNLKKWLDTFDIFTCVNDTLYLHDIHNIIYTLASGVPIIGPENMGLNDFVLNNQNGYLIDWDSEKLAQQIINLEHDKEKRLSLGESGKNYVDKNFHLTSMVCNFEHLIQNHK